MLPGFAAVMVRVRSSTSWPLSSVDYTAFWSADPVAWRAAAVADSREQPVMLTPLLLFLLALVLCGVFAHVLSDVANQPRSRVVLSAVLGYLLAGTVIWSLTPVTWTLSFPQTLAAAVDAQAYGHPVEHYAESLLVVMLVACVCGSAVLGALTAFGGRAMHRGAGRPVGLH